MTTSSSALRPSGWEWHIGGREFFPWLEAMLAGAKQSVRLEMYIFAPDAVGQRVRDALAETARRGVAVQLLVDALGSATTPRSFWDPIRQAGGLVRIFNPFKLRRLPIRNHRKLLVIDESIGWVGGLNVAEEYAGDGVEQGWADVGLRFRGQAARGLAGTFDRIWHAAERPEHLFRVLQRGMRPPARDLAPSVQLCVSGPGRSPSSFQSGLLADTARARSVLYVVAYFVPTRRFRRALTLAARRGARVRVLVPGKSDIPVSHRAARHLYAGLLRAGVEILEYAPQVLHAKLFLTEHSAYVGSSNLDTRSLHINHELMLRLTDPDLVGSAWEVGETLCGQALTIDPQTWRQSRGFCERLQERFSYWLLARVDPLLTRWLVRQPR